MRSDRRKHHRILPEQKRLEVTVLINDLPPITGALLDASAGGVGAQFSGLNCPALMIGQEVQIQLTSQRSKHSLVFSAQVRNRREEQGARRYGFCFTDPEQVESQLPPDLHKLFNRRTMCRLEPGKDPCIQIVLSDGDTRRVEGRLVEISGTGMVVVIPARVDGTLIDSVQVNLSFRLPGCPHPLSLLGTIRTRSFVNGDQRQVQYGIEFNLRSEHALRQQEIIINFIMKRRTKQPQ